MPPPPTREQVFANFAKFGDASVDGKTITLTNADKWLTQAKILDGKRVTTTDTGVCFNKFKMRALNFQDFLAFMEDLASVKNLDFEELSNTLFTCPMPGATPEGKAGGGTGKTG